MEEQQPPPPNPYDTGFIPSMKANNDSMWTEHLDTDTVIEQIEKMLRGYEFDTDTNQWVKSHMTVYGEDNKPVEVEEGPLMNITEIRVIMTWLRTHLNANTFLSKIKEDQINNIAYDSVWVLEKLFYKLKDKIQPHLRGLLSSTLENSIYIGLSRAGEGRRGMTLDAVSSSHHTLEHLQNTPQPPTPQQDKKFKMFGW